MTVPYRTVHTVIQRTNTLPVPVMTSSCLKVFSIVFLISIPTVIFAHGLDVYVIGGTGDLAKRYLWPGFFKLFHNQPEKDINFFGAGKRDITKSDEGAYSPFQELVLQSINCEDEDNLCKTQKEIFLTRTQYIQLSTYDQYKGLCSLIAHSLRDIIFYLSVPPQAYENIIKMISFHCDLKDHRRSYKFVFEKPFGLNLESVRSLSALLNKYLDESQIFRVDHYLGKETVDKILKFRAENQQLDEIMKKKYVKRIEIVVAETLGCKGRTSYYDKSGIVRDMLQSHLTEMLCLMTMNVLKNESKLQLLQNIKTVAMSDVILGQYEDYKNETAVETKTINSKTPTFAAVKMNIMSERWKNVCVKLISGKQLNERTGYGRIIFRRDYFSKEENDCLSSPPQILFVVRHDILNSPAILISRVLPLHQAYIPQDWLETTKYENIILFGVKGRCFRIFLPKTTLEAYTYLITKLYEGDHKYFVPRDELLESWRIWSPVVTEIDHITRVMKYKKGSKMTDIIQIVKLDTKKCYLLNILCKRCDTRPTLFSFLGQPALVAPMPLLIKTLSNKLKLAAINKENLSFHLALSGGNSPLKLYHYLQRHKKNFPWNSTHIWQVDERCSKIDSNFVNLKSHLLDFIPEINPSMIHPMPLFLNGIPCPMEAATMYEISLLNLTSSGSNSKEPQFDFVLLGLGTDGHTASLFPGMSSMLNTNRYIVVGDVPGILAPRRMSMTYKTINSAKDIAILVTGKSKCEILKTLLGSKQCGSDDDKTLFNKYPICGIMNDRVNWYIEDQALECIL